MFNSLKKKPVETKPADVAPKTPAEPSRGLFNPFKKKPSEITADDSSKGTNSSNEQPSDDATLRPKTQAFGQKLQLEKGSNDSLNFSYKRATISKPQKSRFDEAYTEKGSNGSLTSSYRRATISKPQKSRVDEAYKKFLEEFNTIDNDFNQCSIPNSNIAENNLDQSGRSFINRSSRKQDSELMNSSQGNLIRKATKCSKAPANVSQADALDSKNSTNISTDSLSSGTKKQPIPKSQKSKLEEIFLEESNSAKNDFYFSDPPNINIEKNTSKNSSQQQDSEFMNSMRGNTIQKTTDRGKTPAKSTQAYAMHRTSSNYAPHKNNETILLDNLSESSPAPTNRGELAIEKSNAKAENPIKKKDSKKNLKSEVDKYLMDREINPKLTLLRRTTITRQNSNQLEKERNTPTLGIDENKKSDLGSEPPSRKNQEYHSTLDIYGCMVRFRKVARSIGIFSVWFKYLSSHLKQPVQRGWEYDPNSYLLNNPYALKKKTMLGVDLSILNEFKRILPYKGKLDENIRTLFRKPAKDRTPNDLNILLDYVSRMNGFEKYSETSQRIFLQYGRYEKWNSGTTIMRQGAVAESFFILLEGELIISKIFDTDGYAAAISEAKEDQTAIDAQFIKKLGKFVSGDSFGEAVFGSQAIQLRTATLITLKPSEFLIVNSKDSGVVGKISGDKSIQSRIDLIIQSPLLSSLKIDQKVLSYYCKLKTFKMDQHVIKEAECQDYVYFIKSGLCQIQKTIKTWKTPTGKLIITELDGAVLKNESIFPDDKIVFDQLEFVKSDTVALGELGPGDWFGEGQFSKVKDPREALFGPSFISVKVMNRSDIMLAPKADIDRYAMKPVWEAFRAKTKEISKDKLYELYKNTTDWIDLKKDMNVLNN